MCAQNVCYFNFNLTEGPHMNAFHKNSYYGKRKQFTIATVKTVKADMFRCYYVFVELAFVSLLMGYHFRSRVLT
jgi:hypothetical protein